MLMGQKRTLWPYDICSGFDANRAQQEGRQMPAAAFVGESRLRGGLVRNRLVLAARPRVFETCNRRRDIFARTLRLTPVPAAAAVAVLACF